MSKKTKKITSIGGSALIEGIMMRGPKKSTVCVRTGKDEIYSEDISINTIPSKCSITPLNASVISDRPLLSELLIISITGSPKSDWISVFEYVCPQLRAGVPLRQKLTSSPLETNVSSM